MNLKSLVTNLVKSLDWHPQPCITFASMLTSMIDQSNVQHHALSRFLKQSLPSLKSRLERIPRFFAKQEIEYEAFAKNLTLYVFKTIPAMELILDRTNWKLGKKISTI